MNPIQYGRVRKGRQPVTASRAAKEQHPAVRRTGRRVGSRMGANSARSGEGNGSVWDYIPAAMPYIVTISRLLLSARLW
jgi:hypothetical protein